MISKRGVNLLNLNIVEKEDTGRGCRRRGRVGGDKVVVVVVVGTQWEEGEEKEERKEEKEDYKLSQNQPWNCVVVLYCEFFLTYTQHELNLRTFDDNKVKKKLRKKHGHGRF